MRILVDATTLIALGTVGELDHLRAFDGDVAVPAEVRTEVTTEPAATNLDAAFESGLIDESPPVDGDFVQQARNVLDAADRNGDGRLVAEVLQAVERDRSIAIVSDDRRVRTVCRGLGATVTGTIGVIVRAVDEGLPPAAGKRLVRRIDDHGLHLTGELRDRADELIEDAADET